jgi:anti-sigma regulatory factor (Ser/Thr protein kinase)
VVSVETRLELNERAIPANVRAIRHRVLRAARDAGAAEPVLDEIGLCVGEAVANAARHAYGDELGSVTVFVQSDALSLTVTVRDRGIGLGPAAESAQLRRVRDENDDGGFGLRIIERLAREVSMWSAPGQGTVLRMRFSLEAPRTRHSSRVGRHAHR